MAAAYADHAAFATRPAEEFTNGGRSHAYLPHAVEGFFLNGGKRAYVTRVVPDTAEFATRDLFFEDPAIAAPGDTVLLRSAQQGSGTAVNQPLLMALDPANFAAPNDWIRIGNGSRAEYRQVVSIGANQQHAALSFPLRFAHAAEFAALGLIAGLTAAVAAATLSGVIATQVFEQSWAPDWRLALMGGGIGVIAVTLTGLFATRRVAKAPPSETLRALQL